MEREWRGEGEEGRRERREEGREGGRREGGWEGGREEMKGGEGGGGRVKAGGKMDFCSSM